MDPRKLLEQIHGSYSQSRALVVFHLFEISPEVATAESELTAAAS
jgi:hypothetical protein